ncbi:MAG: SusC/RagA family TonB-linked outer membrane protein [Salinibacter sp.]
MRYRSSILTLVLLGLALCVGTAAAQEQEITGTVTSADDNAPLPGANVSVPGTTIGTATDAQGAYALSVPSDADSLRFSFVGFRAQTVAIAGRTTIDVALVPAARQIEELVVVGYGQQEQEKVTGSYSQVDTASFNRGSFTSPAQLISGKVPGLSITPSGGAPGASSTIRIRGASSVNADSSPLFVVDGVPISNEGNQASRNPLNFLNPSNIKSVNVLKDASATAIYGARAANGVIIIETKGASEGTSRISYSGSASSSSVTDRVDVLGPDKFRQVVAKNAPGQLSRLGDARTDWQDRVDRTAFTHEHNLSFIRGYEDSNIRLSLNYRDQQGTLHSSSTKRISTSLKYNQDFLDDALTIRTNLRGAKIDNSFAPGVVGTSASFAPTQPIRDPGSPYGGFFEYENPLADKNPVAQLVLSRNNGQNYRSLGSIEGEYTIPFLTGLSARVKVAYDVQRGEREFFASTDLRAFADTSSPGRLERRNFSRSKMLLDAFLSYDRDFDAISSSFSATAGYSWEEQSAEFPEFYAENLSFDVLGPNSTLPVSDTEDITSFVSESQSRLISFFGRVNYTFKDRYIAKVSIRRDGSSRFGPEQRWGIFPSASVGWRINREPFLKDVDFLSNLKLRASWGQTGNQEIGNFLYESLAEFGGPQAQVLFGDEWVTTLRPGPADPGIKWESTATYNVGIDYGFLDGRFTGAVEYYQKITDDLLFQKGVPGGSNLRDRVLTNIGSMRNTGIEASLNAQLIEGENFSYNFQVNAAKNSNEITDIPSISEGAGIPTGGISGGVGNTIQIIQENEPINTFYVYEHKMNENGNPRTDRVDHNGDGTINGVDMYVDQDKNGQITSADLVAGESPQPSWTFGHTSRATYRGLDLSFTLRAELGNHVYNNVASNYGHFARLRSFSPSNVQKSVLTTQFQQPQYFSDYYVEDASFLRMDNISLGYTFDAIPGVSQLRVYGTVANVFVLTGYSGPDPEVSGIDNNLYPRSRTYTAGINLKL